MKFSLAWAQTAAQNVTLKVALSVLCFVSGTLALSTVKLASRKPIIIDRGCFSATVEPSGNDHSASEVEAFVREAIRQRFNSDAAPIPDFLSEEEISARNQEQKEFSGRAMTQTVIVRSVKANESTVTIDADRLIAVAQIRSAFSFPLMATIRSTTRSQGNPYGLQLVKLTPQKAEQK